MSINAIFACDSNYGIGKDNDLPWPKNQADLLWFKNNTSGHVVVMGRKTWESLGCKKLPDRINVVVTNRDDLDGSPDKIMKGDIGSIIMDLVKEYPNLKIWIIGGADLYRQAIPYCKGIYMTKFHGEYECDTFIQPTWMIDFRELAKKKTNDADFMILGRLPS